MSQALSEIVQTAVDAAAPRLRDLCRFLWANPELGWQEEKAHAALTDLLTAFGFQVQRHAVTPTAFIAQHGDTARRPHIVFLCEYDALPGIGHACGHNLIATAAVGAGVAVRAAMNEAGLDGRVTVLGTPAEETGGGKIDFIEAAFFDDVDAAMMVHPDGGNVNVAAAKFNALTDFKVEFEGRASHAASNPWEAINALDAAVQAYQNVANLRQHLRPGCRVAGIILRGGDVPNVIPERTEMAFTLRAPTASLLQDVERRWRACVEAAATATGCSLTVALMDRPYADVVPNMRLCAAYRAHAKAVGVETEETEEEGGSTDAGNVSYVVPTIHPCFAIGSEAHCHEREFAKDAGGETAFQRALDQARILAMTGLEVLRSAEMRRDMEEEFKEMKKASGE